MDYETSMDGPRNDRHLLHCTLFLKKEEMKHLSLQIPKVVSVLHCK